MIKIFSGKNLENNQALAQSMFKDRTKQFHDRLGWKVHVDHAGREKDEYDLPHTLYVIAVDQNGLHAGSMRLLPTTSNTMISDHFSHLIENIDFVSPLIWECTRFCLSEKAVPQVTALQLFAAGADILQQHRLKGFIAVFDPFMERIYRRYGVKPEVLGTAHDDEGRIVKVGIWHDDNLVRSTILERAAAMVRDDDSSSHRPALAHEFV
jgi:acyl homoserine lactone synthase